LKVVSLIIAVETMAFVSRLLGRPVLNCSHCCLTLCRTLWATKAGCIVLLAGFTVEWDDTSRNDIYRHRTWKGRGQ